jgi:menaquinone-9 beta-reductase
VGADGIGSRMRRAAGLERPGHSTRYGISAHVMLERDAGEVVDIYFERGYEIYVTPVGPRLVNVAVLAERGQLGSLHGDAAGWFERLISGHPALGGQAVVQDDPLVAGPFGVRCTRPWRGNLVLVGDAAGFSDPISGEGMSTSLVSARLCAEAVQRYLATGDEAAFQVYAKARRALVREADVLAKLSLLLAARPVAARLALRYLAGHPQLFARLVATSTGEAPMRLPRPSDLGALVGSVSRIRRRRG